MVKTTKKKSTHTEIKNVDISNIINLNQLGGSKKKIYKQDYNKSEYGSSNDDDDDEDDEEPEDEQDEPENDQDEPENDELENEPDDIFSEKSEKDSVVGDEDGDGDEGGDDDEKNYIDDEETLKTKCYSKYAKVVYDELDFDEIFGDETLVIEKNVKVSKPVLTKYEFVRLLTDRTKQLAQGAKHMLKNTQELSSKEIAKLEIKEGVIPLIIERPIPNSKSERWKVSELQVPEHFFSM